MKDPAFIEWLLKPRTEIAAAVAECVRTHVATLRSLGIRFYGYALLPGETYDIHSLIAVANTEAGIKVPYTNGKYRYYRYCVDEWEHWEREGFEKANDLLAEANTKFNLMHSKEDGDCRMDEYEVVHSEALLEAVVQGLEIAKFEGVFGVPEPFLAVWISDSGHEILPNSVRRLNSEAISKEFLIEFG
jgi:Domain of unknown function (DUF4303)